MSNISKRHISIGNVLISIKLYQIEPYRAIILPWLLVPSWGMASIAQCFSRTASQISGRHLAGHHLSHGFVISVHCFCLRWSLRQSCAVDGPPRKWSVLHGIGRDFRFGLSSGLWWAEELPTRGVEPRTAVNRVQKKTKRLHNVFIVAAA